MKKAELVKKIAAYKTATTAHKDTEKHERALNKMTTRELELIAKRHNIA